MLPIKTESSTDVYRGGGVVLDLPCQIQTDGKGNQESVASVWEPDEEERAAIAAGANIKLRVDWPLRIPPMALYVTEEKRV